MTKTKPKIRPPDQLQIQLLINGRRYVVRPLLHAIGLDLLADDGVRHQITLADGREGSFLCSCPDAFYRKKRGDCKHLRAIKKLQSLFNLDRKGET